MTIKWDALKNKAKDMAVGNIPYCFEKMAPYALIEGIIDNSFNWKQNVTILRNKVIQIIDNWDIRRVKTLIDLFPGIVSTSNRNRHITCYMDDNWMVSFE
jgi:hypothetical protein